MTVRKKPGVELRNFYHIFLETGLIIVLILFSIAARIDIPVSEPGVYIVNEQEVAKIKDIIQPPQITTPPPPPRPAVPVEVPDDKIIDDIEINIDAEFRIGDPLALPPLPSLQSDKDTDDEEKIFEVVEHMPELIGGMKGLLEKIRYPEMARRAGIEGRVFVEFVVDENGDVVNPRVVRSIGGGADEEALRVVSQAKFRPGMQRGRPVKVQYMLPIYFRLQN